MKKLILLATLAACASVDDVGVSDEQGVGSTEYVDILDYAGTDVDAWIGIRQELDHEFDNICGDTFCGGDYSNLTPLTFTCSVTSKIGKVKDCTWTFAGSLASIDPKTAAIAISAPTYQCHIKPTTTAKQLVALLRDRTDALRVALPGTTSIYDQLGDCFQHPLGATPLTFVSDPAPTYVSASEYYTSATGYARWRAAQAALEAGFDRVCGDTFCGGDFGDLQSLDFVCSITKSTGNVKSCAWVFGGSYVLPAATLAPVSSSFRCNVPVKGTLSQLITTLTAAGTDDAINRPLPGTTATAYDALLGCLP